MTLALRALYDRKLPRGTMRCRPFQRHVAKPADSDQLERIFSEAVPPGPTA